MLIHVVDIYKNSYFSLISQLFCHFFVGGEGCKIMKSVEIKRFRHFPGKSISEKCIVRISKIEHIFP